MKKLSSSSTNKLLLKYVVKVLLTTIISILLFSLIFSRVIYKLDLDLDTAKTFSFFIVFLCSAATAFISVLSIKNNGALMGILAQLPLIFYMLINLIINSNIFVLFIIKLVISLLTGALFGILATKKSNKFKVK